MVCERIWYLSLFPNDKSIMQKLAGLTFRTKYNIECLILPKKLTSTLALLDTGTHSSTYQNRYRLSTDHVPTVWSSGTVPGWVCHLNLSNTVSYTWWQLGHCRLIVQPRSRIVSKARRFGTLTGFHFWMLHYRWANGYRRTLYKLIIVHIDPPKYRHLDNSPPIILFKTRQLTARRQRTIIPWSGFSPNFPASTDGAPFPERYSWKITIM